MSLLLWPISKLPLTKKPVSSCFSTATTSRSKPYLLLRTKIKESVLNFNLYDPTKNKEVVKNLKIQDQSETLMNLFQESQKIGSSRGYLALRKKKDSSVYLVDISNDQLKPKILSLPPLNIDNGERNVINVSVSSPVNGDVIVAVKFYGSRLSLCQVGDSEWTRIDVPCPSFEYESVIYSERDERFYLNNGDRYNTDTIDFTPKSGLVTPVSGYPFPITLAEYEKDVMGSSYCELQEQLVESPSGQSFIVCWVTCDFNNKGEMVASHWDDDGPMTRNKTQKIIVYKQDEEEEICSYTVTKDIGDFCMFIGKNEAFCVSASNYPDLKPNTVYFAGRGSDIGVCDLSSQTIHHFSENITPFPYFPMFWIPPTPTLAS